MIGNETDATLAVVAAGGSRENLYSDYGCSRQVYLINDVIYKIEKEIGSNDDEWRRYNSIDPAMLPPHIRIPEMSRYVIGDEIVIAAEFVRGTQIGECFEAACIDLGECICDAADVLPHNVAEDIRMGCDITDLAFGNVLVSNGAYYVIDLEI